MEKLRKGLTIFGVIWAITCFFMYPMVDPFVAGGGPDDAVKGMDNVLFFTVEGGIVILLIGIGIYGIWKTRNK